MEGLNRKDPHHMFLFYGLSPGAEGTRKIGFFQQKECESGNFYAKIGVI